MFKHDLIVIGGGILGLSHAYHALKKGLKVLMIEKNYQAMGASILNFGQVVPSGFGVEWQKYGIASTKHYLDIAANTDIFVRKEGSIYIASDEDEMTLIEELHHINTANAYPSQLITAQQCKEKYPMLKDSYVKGALFFPDEINADSRKTIPAITNYLVQGLGLKLIFGKRIVDIYETENEAIVFDTAGDKWVGGGQLFHTSFYGHHMIIGSLLFGFFGFGNVFFGLFFWFGGLFSFGYPFVHPFCYPRWFGASCYC
ncbi:MAG: FAD-dependent oxidoreductase [Saprospiraceae bacterium]|jgi:glycine/D-amino acid oxidase-like deaminating enzyme|nr:FAD-dependent oxidoreductase [Saprospiraceae bacterium]